MSVRRTAEEGGAILRVTLDAGKGNVLDAKHMAELDGVLADAAADLRTRAVLLDAAGPHFSFGASVEEHRPEQAGPMLRRFHALIRRMLESPLPILVAIRGQCLGGGLEVALAASRLFAHPSAKLGQPEITLGVFAPPASALLPLRIGQAAAEDLLLSGRSVDAAEALAMGLVQSVCGPDEDPAAAALAWARERLMKGSASSLRFAHRAARRGMASGAATLLAELERFYLEELMATPDAREGIAAFLEKRPPRWGGGEKS